MWGYGIGVLYKTCPWKKNSEFSRLFKLFVKCDELIDYFSHLSQEWFVHIFDFFSSVKEEMLITVEGVLVCIKHV